MGDTKMDNGWIFHLKFFFKKRIRQPHTEINENTSAIKKMQKKL